MPSRSAARHTSTGSPTGSAAATSSNERVCSGRASSRRRKLSWMLADSGTALGRANPPASSAGVNPRGSSNSASGLPRASATIRSRTCASSGPVSAASSSARASASGRPSTTSSGNPANSLAGNAGREHQADRIRRQATGHEPEDLGRGVIQPLRVIDQADQGVLLGHLRQQAQHGQPDQERGPAPTRNRGRTRSATQHAGEPGDAGGAPASVRTAGATRRTRAPSPTQHPRRAPPGSPTRARPGSPAAPSCPRPARPRTTRARLSPARAASRSRSSTSHSRRRSRNSPAGPCRPEGRRLPGPDTTPPPRGCGMTRRSAPAARPSWSRPRWPVWKHA